MDKPLAISMGEPAGVGPDLILALYAKRVELDLPEFCVFGHADLLKARAARLGLDIEIATVGAPGTNAAFATALPVSHVEGLVPDNPGQTSPLSAAAVIRSIEAAVEATMTGECRGLVTGPIHKAALYNAGFRHPGHTEFLAELCAMGGKPRLPVMMLAHGGLRAVPVTIHVPIRAVPDLLTKQLIVDTIKVLAHDLKQRFGIANPQIGVAGLNPHAGEGGAIGREDLEIVGPAVAQLQFEGIGVEGPLPADTLFYPAHWARYDAVVAMYHDQALIPIKTVAFEEAVNVTLGLPIVRTSPDHGTAFDLAGTGRASYASFLAAIRMADAMTANQ
ncbi:4-hydroxythreonine-4-phosphate dehydrogenase PdxA [Devosia psychrophila]|uniref:4-hydroxythreonine-4-phosphate dehydrogenase n=1 Tax=Devosia psychrophila TaxID=728005 RepID=A0A0F5Q1Y2_9HYPH|nr:4-hydroxythreonine-4-phosphate dehydrogenase PdxA [Devosia psychrophila]KKC34631.1 4-hydroxythreonine-4-phosphate dehydrogenase [Devosia psychrophila]SFD01244.1 4-hydroxythreonine-4-phosphate dehydrogenase [Devosia psychrophila]